MVQLPHNQAHLYHIWGALNGLCACFGLISWDEHLEGHRPSTSTPSPSSCFSAMLATTLWKSITIPTMASIIYKSYQCRHINVCDVIDWWEIFIGGKYYEEESGEHITYYKAGHALQYNNPIHIPRTSAPPHVNMDHSKPAQKTSAHFFLLNLHGMSMWWSIYLACPIAVRCMLHDVVGVGGVSGDLHHH